MTATVYGVESTSTLARKAAAVVRKNTAQPYELEDGPRVFLDSFEIAPSDRHETCVEVWFFAENTAPGAEDALEQLQNPFVRLNAVESAKFVAALLDPPPPTDAMLEAAARYRQFRGA